MRCNTKLCFNWHVQFAFGILPDTMSLKAHHNKHHMLTGKMFHPTIDNTIYRVASYQVILLVINMDEFLYI